MDRLLDGRGAGGRPDDPRRGAARDGAAVCSRRRNSANRPGDELRRRKTGRSAAIRDLSGPAGRGVHIALRRRRPHRVLPPGHIPANRHCPTTHGNGRPDRDRRSARTIRPAAARSRFFYPDQLRAPRTAGRKPLAAADTSRKGRGWSRLGDRISIRFPDDGQAHRIQLQ